MSTQSKVNKHCKKCGEWKKLGEYRSYMRQGKITYKALCINCEEELRAQPNAYCRVCKETKDKCEFDKATLRTSTGVDTVCKKCRPIVRDVIRDREKARERYNTNEDKRIAVRGQSKVYRETHRESVLLQGAKIRAKQNNLAFNLELTDIVIPKYCPILEIELTTKPSGARKWNSPSIDRVNSAKGYTKDNIMVISLQANTMKNRATLQELRTFCINTLKLIDNKI